MRFNWQLVSQTEGDITKYYLLNNKNEAIEYVGRKDPWSPLTVGTKEQYLYMDNAQGSMQEVTTYGREYITGENANSRATASVKPSMEKNALRHTPITLSTRTEERNTIVRMHTSVSII